MPTRYVEIVARSRPFDQGPDENDRHVLAWNLEAIADAPVDSWEEDIVQLLEDAGLGTEGTDIFYTAKATIPSGDGPYTLIIATGGLEPDETHDGLEYEQLSAQVSVRAKTASSAWTRALAVWRELDGKRDVTVAS